MPIDDLIAASGLDETTFSGLVELCARIGHFRRDTWERERVIQIPAMERRADEYTRKLARRGQRSIDFIGGN